ncbi:TAP42 domain containing protein [Trichuris trichiura]|uniref:TAP42 domain containing protein n=1 Tax=Trichuris trichiura TaxID=36087 RepID=A0A077Z5R0_TRITR|nr:TAP42 domain containing protein [Trichuris trichiura]
MVKKEIDEHVPLYAEFAELGIRADEIIESRTLTPVSAEECLEMSGKFEKLMADIDNGSQLYSGNRTKGEMKLRELRMLKAPAYIGMLMMIGDFPDEKEYLEKAIAYMIQYLALLRHLRIFKDNDADALMSSNGINYVDYLKNVAMLSYHKRLRRKLLK